MNITLRQILTSLAALLVALLIVSLYARNPARIGEEPLLVRALLLNLAVLSGLVAFYPFNPLFSNKPLAYFLSVCAPAMLPALFYFLYLLPVQASNELLIEQTANTLITDSSSNAIVEVGFSYPIYTPTVSLVNAGLFTESVMVFLRMTAADGEEALFRGVRREVPGQGLNVEASVRGMLSENAEYLFNPIALPPGRPVSGRVVFIISNLDDGASFTAALREARAVELELRDPVTGELRQRAAVDRD